MISHVKVKDLDNKDLKEILKNFATKDFEIYYFDQEDSFILEDENNQDCKNDKNYLDFKIKDLGHTILFYKKKDDKYLVVVVDNTLDTKIKLLEMKQNEMIRSFF